MLPWRADYLFIPHPREPGASGRLALRAFALVVTPSAFRRLGSALSLWEFHRIHPVTFPPLLADGPKLSLPLEKSLLGSIPPEVRHAGAIHGRDVVDRIGTLCSLLRFFIRSVCIFRCRSDYIFIPLGSWALVGGLSFRHRLVSEPSAPLACATCAAWLLIAFASTRSGVPAIHPVRTPPSEGPLERP